MAIKQARSAGIIATIVVAGWSEAAAQAPNANAVATAVARIEAVGGHVVRDKAGTIERVSLARTWATDNDIDSVVRIPTIKHLDLSFTYVTDIGIRKLRDLRQLEELNLDTAEFVTDVSMAHLRANLALRWLRVRGVDITDAGMPYVSELKGLTTLDLSHTMVGDVGLEHLPALAGLEELKLGGNLITGLNLNFLKLLPKLKRLSFNGIQRRNGGACWSPRITDLDLETLSLLSHLEELDLGVGLNLGVGGRPAAPGGSNCRINGGVQVTDFGLSKLAKLKNLRRLNISGARLTSAGLKALQGLPLERLSLWNCDELDSSATDVLAAIPTLTNLDLSYTPIDDNALKRLATLPNLKLLYLTETQVTADGVAAFRQAKSTTFVSWARRPRPRAPLYGAKPIID